MDYTPIEENHGYRKTRAFRFQGRTRVLSDSTNVERPGHTQSEREIGKTFEHYFDTEQGRVIVASFASNIYRIQQVADVAIAHGRVICFQGAALVNIAQTAIELGYLNIPAEKIVDVEKLRKYNEDQVCVITTGSQGEPMSGLFRMANASHRLNIGKGDTVIISASAIPGNERGVSASSTSYSKRARWSYTIKWRMYSISHACREELRLMFNLTKPKYFIPVHGEYRHLYMHAQLAREMGVEAENVFVADIGDIVELTCHQGKINGSVPAGSVMVDGLGIGDIGNVVLKDRRLLSQDGLAVVVIALQKKSGKLLAGPEIISRGFVYMRESEELISEARNLLQPIAASFEQHSQSDWATIKNSLRAALREYLYDKTKRNPVILPIIVEIP